MPDKFALVFGGGGAKGAFGAGVFEELHGRAPTRIWDIVSGTSTGALIAPLAALAMSEPTIIQEIAALYRSATKRGIFEPNVTFPKILWSLRKLKGLNNLSPLRALIDKHIGNERLERLASGQPTVCIVNAVNLQTGHLALCAPDPIKGTIEAWLSAQGTPAEMIPFTLLRAMMRASASVPVGTDPQQWKDDGYQYVDGGVLDVAPLRGAIAAGATRVLVVLMSPTESETVGHRENLLAIGLRAVDLLSDEIARDDAEYADHVTDDASLAKLLLNHRQTLPAELARWVDENLPRVISMSQRREIQVEVIQPEKWLGSPDDFESLVPDGWPMDTPPTQPKTVPIMRARYNHGRAVVKHAIETRRSLRQMLGLAPVSVAGGVS